LSNKEKLIASAQKSLLKGQVAKAIKDYQKVVEIDPKDIRNRQKLAELFVRAKMLKEAQEQYESVARHFSDNGFFLKAIAVYKQIQKIEPSRVEIYQRLAELNAKQGLVGNALAEYKALVAHYEKRDKLAESIGILQKMKELDPENLNVRVRIAENSVKSGLRDKGLAELRETLQLLRSKREYGKALKLFDIFLPLFPDEPEVRAGYARALIDRGDLEQGVRSAREVLQDHPGYTAALRVLALGLHRMGDYAGESKAYLTLLESGSHDLGIREGYLQACLNSENYDEVLERLELWQNDFLEAHQAESLKIFYEKLFEVRPEEPRVVESLKTLYQTLGEGEKLLDLLSFSGDESLGQSAPAAPGKEEILEVSVFEEARRDLAEEGEDVLDIDASGSEEEYPELELETFHPDPQSTESPANPPTDEPAEEVLELELGDDLFADLEPAQAEASLPRDEQSGDIDLADLELIDLPDFGGSSEDPPAPQTNLEPSEPSMTDASALEFGEDELQELDFEIESNQQSHDAVEDVAASPSAPPGRVGKTDQERLDGDFTQFKKSLERHVDAEDSETHFNLGIAFKEMGLLDDAVSEFDQAMRSASRRLDALTLKGICLKDKGDLDGAEGAFKAALELPDVADVNLCNLYFELALLAEGRQHPKDALAYFEKSAGIDPSFRDAGQRIAILRRQLGQSGGDDQGRVSYL
jgi:tetratricopeptide (TPR) repeat protein